MKSDLSHYIQEASNQMQAINWMREYLQARILSILQSQEAMNSLAFHGGTALRFLFHLPRYSEDLDFALEKKAFPVSFQDLLQSIKQELTLEGYQVTIKVNDHKTVHNAMVNFIGLLHEFELSQHVKQRFSIKLEVDTNPPAGAITTTSLIRHRELFINLHHHDQSSLFAGKIHALMQRNYLKGRDVYDLIWYLSDRSWPPPNFELLNNALSQSGWEGPMVTSHNWKPILSEKLINANFNEVQQDVQPFLARMEDINLINLEIIKRLL